ncbi:MAG: hypothetical protein U5N21_10725 [Rhodococcus sp. (in: high G+C Gram-positive bacteria)]|nr:hypothetical protein [Rhodococcus sp. (in: high G+C Gram-positive bacteria)]
MTRQFYILSGVIALGVSVIAFRLLTPGGLNYPLAFVYLCMLFAFANLKFDIVMSTIVLAAMWTGFQLPVAGINTRLDTLLMPAGILSAPSTVTVRRSKKSLRELVVLLLIAFIGLNDTRLAVSWLPSIRATVPDNLSSGTAPTWLSSYLLWPAGLRAGERLYRLAALRWRSRQRLRGIVGMALTFVGVAPGGLHRRDLWSSHQWGLHSRRTFSLGYAPLAPYRHHVHQKTALVRVGDYPLVGAGVTITTNTRAATIALSSWEFWVSIVFRGRKSLRILPVVIAVSAGAYAVKLLTPDTYEQICRQAFQRFSLTMIPRLPLQCLGHRLN